LSAAKDAPTVIKKKQKSATKAAVTPNFEEGEVFLRNKAGQFFRLHWTKRDKARKRYIAAGKYRLTGFRVVKGQWFISSTTGKKNLELAAGEETTLAIDSTIFINLKVRKNRALHLQMGLMGHGHAGLSIYHKGKRIPVRYVVEGPAGKIATSGIMKYG
jgi:hypothetical protein